MRRIVATPVAQEPAAIEAAVMHRMNPPRCKGKAEYCAHRRNTVVDPAHDARTSVIVLLVVEVTAKAAPDGYTLGLIQIGNLAINRISSRAFRSIPSTISCRSHPLLADHRNRAPETSRQQP
jgi:hypothetical protein